MDFGRYLRDCRVNMDLSIRKAAAAIGISAMYLSEIESSKKKPSDKVLKKISDFYKEDYLKLLAKSEFSDVEINKKRQAVARHVFEMSDDELNHFVSLLGEDTEFGE